MLATGYKQPDFGFLDQGLFPENFEVGQVLGRRLILLTEGIFLTLETEFVPSKLLYGRLVYLNDQFCLPQRHRNRVSTVSPALLRSTPLYNDLILVPTTADTCTYLLPHKKPQPPLLLSPLLFFHPPH